MPQRQEAVHQEYQLQEAVRQECRHLVAIILQEYQRLEAAVLITEVVLQDRLLQVAEVVVLVLVHLQEVVEEEIK